MRQAKKKKGKDRVTATIALCFCLITLTSIFTIKASIDKVNESAKNLPTAQQVPTASEEEPTSSPDSQGESKQEEKTVPSQDSDTEEAAAAATIIDSYDESSQADFLPPLNKASATISKEYAMDRLLYNETLDQYMAHPGIDLEAPSKASVNAIGDGTITQVYHDDAYGMTVELTLSDDMIARYSNLADSITVEKGDEVVRGQQLGSIGRSALYESMEKDHLHFELYKNGALCNPADYISF